MPPRPKIAAVLATLFLVSAPARADVPPPLAAPPVPTDYCGSIYNELYGDLQTFNTELQTPPSWTPVSSGPTVFSATLPWANSNTGPQLSSADYLPTVLTQLQEVRALGVQAVSVPVLFPILYEPFYGSQAAMQPYLTFYTSVVQAAHAAGLKVIVDNEITFSNDIQAGWSDMNAFYSGLTWPEYMAARATMAATIAQNLQPDYLVLANEPDTETAQTGQQNLGIPEDAAQMIAGEIAAVQALNMPNPPLLGAGFGSWMTAAGTASLTNYLNAYLALPLDYIDYHLLPVNNVQNDNFLDNALTIASAAAAAGKPVAVGQAWLSKVAASEWQFGYNVTALDLERSRQTFSFWAPLDAYFMQTAQTLANYEQMLYLDLEQTFFLASYQPYGGTDANGGSSNCTCTTSSCSDYEIMQAENPLAIANDSVSVYTSTAFSYYNQLVTTPDITPPSMPTGLAGTPGTSGVGLTWNASTDDVGVAGYNVYRCTPPAAGQPCTGVYLASTTSPSYIDSTLTSNTLYNYQVLAYDFVNNYSPISSTLSLQTVRTSADSATNLTATAISAQEIDLSWSAPSDPTGLGEYLVFAGSSPTNLLQVAVRGSTTTTYKNMNLAPGTTYYFGVVAAEEGINSAMSSEASATTLPLPAPPTGVGGTPTTTTIALNWQENLAPSGLPISSYQVYMGTTPGALTEAGPTTSPKYTASSLSPNTTYYFEIEAIDSQHDISVPSNQIAVTTAPLPAAPTGVTATANSGTQVTVSWTEIVPSGGMPIQSYTIFRGTSPTSLTQVATRTATQYIDSTTSTGNTYYYAVEAVDTGKDISPMSATASVTTGVLPAAPVNVAATANSVTQVTVTWTENIPTGGMPIQSYTVFRGTSPTSLTQVATRTTTQYIDATTSSGNTYYYAVEAIDTGKDVSPMSAAASVTTGVLPSAPVNVTATANSATQVTVTWTENIPTGGLPIQNYSIFRGTSPTSLAQVATRTTAQYIDTTTSSGNTYYYAVEAVDTGKDISPLSATASVTTGVMPAAPVNLAATPTSETQVTVSWTENIPTGGLPIQSYTIFRGTSPTSLTQVATRTTTQYIDTTASANTTYYYAAEATDTGKDVSPISTTVTATTVAAPAAPANVGATAGSATQVTVTWAETVPPGGLPVSAYTIFRGTSPGGLTKVATRTTLTFIDTGATANTTYYYAVEATDTGGDVSPMSASVQVSTPNIPAAPTNVAAVANTATQVTVTWSETVPAGGLPIQYYNVYRGSSASNATKLAQRTSLQFTDTTVAAGGTYFYSVQAVDTGTDTSPMSVSVQVTTP